MRNLLILVLGAAVVWLLIERSRLVQEAEVAKGEVGKLQEEAKATDEHLTALGVKRPAGKGAAPGWNAPRRESWLDAHLEKGAKALSNPQGDKNRN